MRRPTLFSPVLFAIALTLASCSEDDGNKTPSLLTDFVEANSQAGGYISSITTDGGKTLTLSQSIKAEVADTTYRCVCTYELSEDSTHATVYGINHIYSLPPHPTTEFEEHCFDPVKVKSVWRTEKYVNIILGVMTTGNGVHQYAFCEDSTTTAHNGETTLHVSLMHKRPADDPESYTQTMYMSMPTHFYSNAPEVISLSIPTYDGIKTFQL